MYVILLYDFDHLDTGCQQFGLRYVFKSNVKTIDFILNAFLLNISILNNDIKMYYSTGMTTSTSSLANTPMSDTSGTSTIAVAVSSVLVVILLVVLGIILWRKKRHGILIIF